MIVASIATEEPYLTGLENAGERVSEPNTSVHISVKTTGNVTLTPTTARCTPSPTTGGQIGASSPADRARAARTINGRPSPDEARWTCH